MKAIKIITKWAAGILCVLFSLWLLISALIFYKPQILGGLILQTIEDDGPVFNPDQISPDWNDWFAMQQRDGWRKSDSPLMTRWGESLTSSSVLSQYPRPQLQREQWLNLNGLWNFNVVPKHVASVDVFPGKILVPFAIEAPLSGVGRPLLAGEQLWYQRTFEIPKQWDAGQRIKLHFAAVDWRATVYVNGKQVGRHEGGYSPFSFDITDASTRNAPNELVVVVWDPTNADGATQSRGKQHLEPMSIFYTATSGIWQTVWLEPVAQRAIDSISATVDVDAGSATLSIVARGESGDAQGLIISVELESESTRVTRPLGNPITLKPDSRKLWSPDSPHLYFYTATLMDGDTVVDKVRSYFALRSVGRTVRHDEPVFTLNGEPIMHLGVLDQGYWPDGGMTAPSDDALIYDLELMKSYGLNTIRKHVKVEPARFYYHADRLGLMVWQDMPSGGNRWPPVDLAAPILRYQAAFGVSDSAMQITDDDYEGWGRDTESRAAFQAELQEMMDSLNFFPSVVMWVPFNEYWGQFDAVKTAQWIKQRDNSRLVNHASGWMDQGAGDVYDEHLYNNYHRWQHRDPLGERVAVLGEFGGKTLSIPNHLWDDEVVGYGKMASKGELFKTYEQLLLEELLPRIDQGLSAIIYTQLSDVESEVNGYVTYDRKVEKFDRKALNDLHQRMYKAFTESTTAER